MNDFDYEKLIEKIDDYLSKNKQEIIVTLLDLVRIPSVRDTAQENMPYGKACNDMLNATAKLMQKHGFETIKRNDLGYTFSLLDNKAEKTIGLYSHGDVVPAVGADWLMCPPFEPIVKDGFMFGRGSNDDKSGIVEMLYATKIIRDLEIPFNSNILMFTGVSEETGMQDIRSFIENEKVPNAGLVVDGACYPCDYGEKTFYKFYITNKNKFTGIKNFYGGNPLSIYTILPKATVVLGYSENCFNQLIELTKNDERYSLKKIEEDIEITAFGVGAPVTKPEKGVNAGLVMIELLLQCTYVSKEDKEILQKAKGYLADGYGRGFGVEYADGYFGKNTCGNGIIAVENGKLKLSFDIRSGMEFDLDEIIFKVKKSVAENWIYQEILVSKGYIVTDDNPIRKSLSKYYQKVMPNAKLEGFYFAGGTHARYLKNTVPIGNQNNAIIPEINLPQGHGGYHQPDENIYVDAFIDGIKILVFLLLGLEDAIND